jgi:hypothetical protein
MSSDYRYGWHDARDTFGNCKPWQSLSTVERHLTDFTGQAGLCGMPVSATATRWWLSIATARQKAPVCPECERAGRLEQATLET